MGQYIENLEGTGLPQMQHPLLRMGIILRGLIWTDYHKPPIMAMGKIAPQRFDIYTGKD